MSENMKKQPRYLTTKQVAEVFGLSKATLDGMRFRKVGPAYVKAGASVLYDPNDVEAWLQANKVQTNQAA